MMTIIANAQVITANSILENYQNATMNENSEFCGLYPPLIEAIKTKKAESPKVSAEEARKRFERLVGS